MRVAPGPARWVVQARSVVLAVAAAAASCFAAEMLEADNGGLPGCCRQRGLRTYSVSVWRSLPLAPLGAGRRWGGASEPPASSLPSAGPAPLALCESAVCQLPSQLSCRPGADQGTRATLDWRKRGVLSFLASGFFFF